MSAGCQQLKTAAESLEQRMRRQDRDPCRCKFDRQRQPVEASTYLDHVGGILVVDGEVRADRLSALDEKLHRTEPAEGVHGRQRPQAGNSQRPHGHHMFAGNPQQSPTRHEHGDPWGATQKLGKRGPSVEQMLEVVQDQQHRARLEETAHGNRCSLVGRLHANSSCDRHHHQIGIADRGQRYKSHRVEAGIDTRGHRERKACLAHPARPGQGHQSQSPAKQQRPKGQRFLLAADQRGQRHRSRTYPPRPT